ncbi:stress-activated map kinase-interacting protein 1 [Aedes albopictus]|uniref:Target of rapamycin complex 2 subunit MAPKAP1 n=1 Tax=Aedes albopictus TaxID=7160 RepID=A0ABM1YPY7_AEDAL|nr:stress-activated map kinase-interacting protein 1-like [Aedes albopictus]
MATYNNTHWLLSHIRNSFISTDDTGLSETVMLLEDIPHQYAHLHKQALREQHSAGRVPDTNPEDVFGLKQKKFESFYCYPGLDDSDDEEMDALSQSYEIQMDQDIGFHRQRSNTAQKLERMDIARRKAAKVKSVKYECAVQQNDKKDDELFTRKDVSSMEMSGTEVGKSLLSQQLENFPKMPQNKFLEFAKYDGTSQTEVATKTFKIFLTMLPENQKAYPMQVCVLATAKIQDFIGLICYKCSLAYPEVGLRSIRHYGLFMTEEDGEIDMDFPPLDVREQCAKFCFSHLAIAERKASEIQTQSSFSQSSTIVSDERTRSITSDLGETGSQSKLSPIEPSTSEFRGITPKQKEDLDKMKDHTSKLDAPLYRAFNVYMVHKARIKTEVQLGISGDKLEIDPIQQKSSKLWPRQKPANHSMDSVAHCSIVDRKSSKSVVRIVYSAVPYAQSLTVSGTDYVTSSPTIRQHQQHQQQSRVPQFKTYDIETDPTSALDIVEKINNILEVRSSPVRREYIASRSSH